MSSTEPDTAHAELSPGHPEPEPIMTTRVLATVFETQHQDTTGIWILGWSFDIRLQVRERQRLLVDLPLYRGIAENVYRARDAVVAFAERHGLPARGAVSSHNPTVHATVYLPSEALVRLAVGALEGLR